MNTPSIPSVAVLGTNALAINLPDAVRLMESWISSSGFGRYVCVTGVHGVMEGMRNPTIQKIHNEADAVVPDGMPLVWLGRKQGHHSMGRVYGPDLMFATLKRAADAGWTNYFYGGAPEVANELKKRMEIKFPGLKVIGTFCPPFRPLNESEESSILSEIERLQPDILWVGLSTPKQELLMARWKAMGIRAKVMVGVGAAFDFHTGRVCQAPRWMQRCGLEWFFRLCMEPRRLAPRYLRNNPLFLWNIGLQLTGLRQYPSKSNGQDGGKRR
jgi:N-acetylglucosaminyldiphosphoundecaprenol N-acetyl-beta-D-mannosaminyltransferase